MAKSTRSKSQSSDIASSPSDTLRSDMRTRITNYIRAGYPGLYLVSHEEQRVDGEMKALAHELNYNLHFWSVVDGMTGSEIEKVFIEALYLAFDSGSEAGEKEPTDLDIAGVLNEFVPLSKLMAELIAGLRNWAKGRARPATSAESERKLRRMVA